MHFSKGKIQNINKKILTGSLALILLTTGLTGCASVSIEDIKYKKNEQGYVQSLETIKNDTLKYCGIYKVRNNKEDKLYYTICLRDDFNGTLQVKYYDIFTGEELKYSDCVFNMVEVLDDYLDSEKTEYKEEELKNILNEFVQKEESYKKLVKE